MNREPSNGGGRCGSPFTVHGSFQRFRLYHGRTVHDVDPREHEGAAARKHLTDGQFSAISWLVIAMNAFNRVSIVSQHPVRKDRGEPGTSGRRQAG